MPVVNLSQFMEVLKPSWIKHADDKNKRQCIFTADVDHENKRLATGGMDSVIRVWRLASLFGEVSDDRSKLLASMTRHNGSVLCVRWSSSGLLASASDDTIILIWQLDSRPAGMRGNLEGLSDEGAVEENYKVVKRLIGHQSDTVGLEWSPDGRVLASCSLDGTICFWDSDPSSGQTLLAKLEQAHKGFIKGLAWDPSGRFLASQSDDGSCAIWNVKNILDASNSTIDCSDENEAEIYREVLLEEMFINTSKMTFFHRPSWSPDASILALANATNRQIPVVALVESKNWQGINTSFVGHLGPIEVVRFNPLIYVHESAVPQGRKEMICAVAGQDGQISIWTSVHSGPILVLQDIFEHTVMDLVWSRDGRVLIAVSYDGTAAAIRMQAEAFELVPLSEFELAEHLRNTLGNRKNLVESSQSGHYLETVQVIKQLHENEAYIADQIHDMKIQTPSPQKLPNLSEQPQPAPIVEAPISAPQVLTVTKDGKKRITPQLLSMSSGPGLSAFGNAQSVNSSFDTANSLTPGRARAIPSGHRLRDEDFMIHKRLMEGATSSLAGMVSAASSYKLTLSRPERSHENMSFSISKAFQITIEVMNQDIGDRKATSIVQLIQGNTIQWKERIRGTVYSIAADVKSSIYAVKYGESRHMLVALSPAGRRLLPYICLDGQVIKMTLKASRLAVFTDKGQLNIWDLSKPVNLISDYLPSSIMVSNSIFVDLDVDTMLNIKLTLSNSEKTEETLLKYDFNLRKWVERMANIPSALGALEETDRISRLENLKKHCLNNPTASNERHMSELELEIALLMVNLKNSGLKPDEMVHFEKILAMYAIKLAKDCKIVKARELLQDLSSVGMADLNENLLRPILCQSNLSHLWQDFISS